MAPKGKDPKGKEVHQPAALPSVEEEVLLPDGISCQEPPFASVVAHVVSHSFVLLGSADGDGEGEDSRSGSSAPEFDPCAVLSGILKEESSTASDALAREVVLLDREELLPLSEGGPLTQGLGRKLEREVAARRRRKSNAARSRAIAEAEGRGTGGVVAADSAPAPLAAPATAAAVAAAAGEGIGEAGEKARRTEADVVFVLLGYPADAEELQALLDEGILDLTDLWVTVYLSGASWQEVLLPPPAEEQLRPPPAAPPPAVGPVAAETAAAGGRRLQGCAPPEFLLRFHRAISKAEAGSALARSSICSLPESHLLASAEGSPAGAIRTAVLGCAHSQLQRWLQFQEWVSSCPEKVQQIPTLGRADTSLYTQLADCISPTHQDVPALLSCLCQQVAFSLSTESSASSASALRAAECGAPAATSDVWTPDPLQLAEGHLAAAHDSISLGDVYATALGLADFASGARAGAGAAAGAAGAGTAGVGAAEHEQEQEPGSLVLPRADGAACLHADGQLPGGISVAGVVKDLLAHLGAPGRCRRGMPVAAPLSAARRSALRNRLYGFLPDVSAARIEQLLLLQDFEQLLEAKQPERRWCLSDRLLREEIPQELFAQTFLRASQFEGFLDTQYLPERDCLLVALHHRALPGHVLWHSWVGDLARLTDSEPGADTPGSVCPIPGFNDWWHMLASKAAASTPPFKLPPPQKSLDQDAREMGYCRVVEKVLTPADGSVILCTKMQRGLCESQPQPSASAKTQTHSSPRYELRSVRVLKGSVAFGMVTDAAWVQRLQKLEQEAGPQELGQRPRPGPDSLASPSPRSSKSQGQGQGGPEPQAEGQEVDAGAAVQMSQHEASASASASLRPRAVTEKRLLDLRFGCFWLAFPDGTRCTARMHHSRPWYAEGEQVYDVTVTRPGALVSFTPTSGLAVQVTSDGCVRQSRPWPPQKAQRSDTGADLEAGSGDGLDWEIARTVTPSGLLLRSFLSGRQEVYHPDGTRAVRRPTLQELQARHAQCLQQHRGGRPSVGDAGEAVEALALLERRIASAVAASSSASEPPSVQEKAAGLPGHWRVTRLDGRQFGRVVLSSPAKERPSGLGADIDAPAPAASAAAPVLEQLEHLERLNLDAVLVQAGQVAEYELDPIPISTWTDPHTGKVLSSSRDGLLHVQDAAAAAHAEGQRHTELLDADLYVFSDGTEMAQERYREGHRITIRKTGVAPVTCQVEERAAVPRVLMTVGFEDGTNLEVTPRRLNHKGELVPSDPSSGSGSSDRFSTNASVLLQRPDGVSVLSRGSGEVSIFHPQGSPASLEPQAETHGQSQGLTMGSPAAVADLDDDVLRMQDASGNAFEVRGSQSVGFKLAVSMGDDFPSPRCESPGRPYLHPDAKYLPLPEHTPPPRLFAVAGSGHAEELLSPQNAQELLQLGAGEEARATLIQEELPHEALEGSSSHSLLRARTAGAATTRATAAAAAAAPAAAADQGVTEYRQLLQSPAVSEQQRLALLEAQKRFSRWQQDWAAGRACSQPSHKGGERSQTDILAH